MTKQQEQIKLWTTLVNTKDAISKLRQRELKQYHISAEQTGVLSILRRVPGGLTPAEISRRLLRDPSSVTVILNRMVAKGLISKSKDKKKKNLIRVTLTKKGDDLYSRILKRMCIYGLFAVLSDEQCQQLQACLNTLLAEATGRLNWPFEITTGRTI
jgi:DNA-binding MarR family transcriptional regulator